MQQRCLPWLQQVCNNGVLYILKSRAVSIRGSWFLKEQHFTAAIWSLEGNCNRIFPALDLVNYQGHVKIKEFPPASLLSVWPLQPTYASFCFCFCDVMYSFVLFYGGKLIPIESPDRQKSKHWRLVGRGSYLNRMSKHWVSSFNS